MCDYLYSAHLIIRLAFPTGGDFFAFLAVPGVVQNHVFFNFTSHLVDFTKKNLDRINLGYRNRSLMVARRTAQDGRTDECRSYAFLVVRIEFTREKE